MDKQAQNIIDWLIENCKRRNAKGFLIDFQNPNVPEVLSVILARKTQRSCYTLIAPQHMTPAYYTIARDNSCCIHETAEDIFMWSAKLAKYAQLENLLVINPINIVERLLVRPWKHFTLISDLFPFGNISKNKIEDMFMHLNDFKNDEYINIYKNRKPDNELYSKDFLFTHEELHWALQANKLYNGIINSNTDPVKHPKWFSLSIKQKKIIAFLHQHSKLSEHKMITTSVCFDPTLYV